MIWIMFCSLSLCIYRFIEHARLEHNTENIDFWLEVSKYAKLSNNYKKIQAETARAIIDRYIINDCPVPINISGRQKSNVLKFLEEEKFDNSIFDESLEEVYIMMSRDMYTRFKRSLYLYLSISLLNKP